MNTKAIYQLLFPQPTATLLGRGGSEVNGLPKGTVPQNCDILFSGLDQGRLGRQEYYLVRVKRPEVPVHLQEADDAFANILAYVRNKDDLYANGAIRQFAEEGRKALGVDFAADFDLWNPAPMVFLRVCTAMEGSGYDEFAVIRDIAFTADAQRDLEAYARESIEAICRKR